MDHSIIEVSGSIATLKIKILSLTFKLRVNNFSDSKAPQATREAASASLSTQNHYPRGLMHADSPNSEIQAKRAKAKPLTFLITSWKPMILKFMEVSYEVFMRQTGA